MRTFEPSSSTPSMWKVTRMIPVSNVAGIGAKNGTSTAPLPPAGTDPAVGMICWVTVIPPGCVSW